MNQDKSIRRNRIMFPLGTVGRDMIYQLFTNFIYTYVLFTRSLTDAQLGAIAGIMIAARIFDALNDPLMGNIIDRTRTRWGKFKPWLTIGILLTSVVVYFAFNSQFEGWSFIIFFGVIYFLFSITYTMHDISYWGMIPSLGSDANERNILTSRTNLFAGIGGTLAGMLIPMFTIGANAIGGNTRTAYGVIALVFCVLAPLFLSFTIFGVKENREYEREPAPPISFKKILRTILQNDQLRWIVVIFLLQQIGNGLILGGMGTTYIYFEFGYQGGLYSIFSTIGVLATAFLMIFYPVISRRITRKALMKKMIIVSAAGYGVMLLAGLLMPQGNQIKFWVITLAYMFSNLGQYAFYLIMMISILNTVEYNEYKTGHRDDAIIASVRPFMTKLSSALIVAITTLSYILFRVTNFTNQISTLEQQASLNQITEAETLSRIESILSSTEKTQTFGLLLVMSLVPFLFMLGAHFLYQKHYKLDEEEYERICRELRKEVPDSL